MVRADPDAGLFTPAEAGRLGGLSTVRRYGRRHMAKLRRTSSSAGRTRLPTFEELMGDPRAARVAREIARRMGVDPASLTD